MVKFSRDFPFIGSDKKLELIRVPHVKEEDKGATVLANRWTDKQPHPHLMSKYDEYNSDAEVDIALDVLTGLITGVGFHTEMPEDIKPNHPNKQIIDEYCERINADEKFRQIERTKLGKGFCPVEILSDYDLKILPPETFYIWKTNKGKIYKYTQEINSTEVAKWEGKDLKNILLFINEEDTSHPYGQALSDSIGSLLDIRKEMNVDIGKALHRYAWPKRAWQYENSIATIKEEALKTDIDEDLWLGNIRKDALKIDTLQVDPATRFQSSIEMVYYQIAEGLHAPLLLYLKNATEASATVMMESVDRLVDGAQRYDKRRIERYLFEPQVSEPVPRLVWGQPQTGLEKITLSELASILNSPKVAFNQAQYILKQFFTGLPEPEKEPQQQLPFQPFQKQKPEIPMEQMLEKLNDLQTGLSIIESNFVERRITVVDAMRLADKTISVYCKRVYGDEWQGKSEAEFEKFSRRILQVPKRSEVYQVKVE